MLILLSHIALSKQQNIVAKDSQGWALHHGVKKKSFMQFQKIRE